MAHFRDYTDLVNIHLNDAIFFGHKETHDEVSAAS